MSEGVRNCLMRARNISSNLSVLCSPGTVFGFQAFPPESPRLWHDGVKSTAQNGNNDAKVQAQSCGAHCPTCGHLQYPVSCGPNIRTVNKKKVVSLDGNRSNLPILKDAPTLSATLYVQRSFIFAVRCIAVHRIAYGQTGAPLRWPGRS